MDFNNREAMAWVLASFLSLIAWLAAAQITLLSEQLRIQDGGAGHSGCSGVPRRTPPEEPARPSSSPETKEEDPGQPSSSLPHYHVGYVFTRFQFEGDRPVHHRVRSPRPVVGRARTSLDVPLWVPDEFNWDRGSIPFAGGYVYRNEGVPPWDDEANLDMWYRTTPRLRHHGVEGFYQRWANRRRPERRRSWPPDSRMPAMLRPAGSKASHPHLDML